MAKRRDQCNKVTFKRLSRRDFLKYSGGTLIGVGSGIVSIGSAKGSECQTDSTSNLYRHLRGIDKEGALITAAKIDPLLSYAGEYQINGQSPAPVITEGVADLLAAYLQSEAQGAPSQELWKEIEDRIDYTYEGIDMVLRPILGGIDEKNQRGRVITLTKSGKMVQKHVVKGGKKLFFKPNLVAPEVLSLAGTRKAPLNMFGTPGGGIQGCTDWTFLAALMRWFHDNLEISYYQMAMGDASTVAGMYAKLYGRLLGFSLTTEAVYEGRISAFDGPNASPGSAIYYGGYPFFFVRKYLQDRHDPAHSDDPMQGHLHSQQGTYLPPGAANNILAVYNLANAEASTAEARGRVIAFPQGVQYKEITVHKAIVGDPADRANYPGCVLINVPKLKIHSVVSLTNAIKNLGIGLWPNDSGVDADPNTPDLKYGMPSTLSSPGCPTFPVGNLKGGVQHTRQSHGIQFNCDGALVPASKPSSLSDGIKGSMVDIDLAVLGLTDFVPYALHISEAIAVTNMSHGGGTNGVSKNEGLIFASEDPVALDLLAARYLFKNVPKGTVPDHPFAMYTPFTDVRYDSATKTILSSVGGYEFPIENEPLFAYAESRGLGTRRYHVAGLDLTASGMQDALLASKHGHLGKIVFDGDPSPITPYTFAEIITQTQNGVGLLPHYASVEGLLWPLQNTVKRLGVAVDALTEDTYGFVPGYEAKLMASDLDADSRFAFGDDAADADITIGISSVGYGYLSHGQPERGRFHIALKTVKYFDACWNSQGTARVSNALPFYVAVSLAMQPQSASTLDKFFGGKVYGRRTDGTIQWPSLQWARYMYDLNGLKAGHASALAYAKKKGYTFKILVPNQLAYFPVASNPFLPLGLSEIEETTSVDDMFVAKFFNQAGEEVEQW